MEDEHHEHDGDGQERMQPEDGTIDHMQKVPKLNDLVAELLDQILHMPMVTKA
jgi:hypothetical protein